MAQYINSKELYTEIIKSKEKGELTPKALEMLMKMAAEISKVFKYVREEDRQDCIAFSIGDLLRYWNRFDPEKSNNVFAYMTQIAKNGIYKGWRQLYPIKASMKISLDNEHGIHNL